MGVKRPGDEEMAAIVAALASVERPSSDTEDSPRRVAAWQLTTRLPDLEFDDLLALRHACSIKF